MSDDKARRDDAPDDAASTVAGTPALTTVSELMEERRRYEAWLQSLEARRSETPKHVFTRVHADYTARLETVIARLTTHADGMRAALTALTTRLANLDEQQHRARDERAEAELRAHVGELARDAWEKLKEASDKEIADLARKHAETAAELERTKAIVADAERPATPVPSSPTVKRLASAMDKPAPPKQPLKEPIKEPPDSAEADLHVPAGTKAGGTDSEPARDAGFDELAFLHSVVDAPTTNGAAKESSPRPAPPPRAPAPPRPAPVPKQPVARNEPPTPEPVEELTLSHAEPDAPKIIPKRGGALAANVSGNNPVILKDKPSDSGKTLKCAECGALNYPTEWYCERCGAELASM
ncbi:MAG TPA: hypothetical protein VGG84_06290 [Gemmatimonadaceae bacterium]